ncbi:MULTISPECIES: ABC transporter substrate-binding protein [unclassified Pseudarthrobacter]|uniref:ABC transporter substrate-binding protein n=1 Tax=unclassified Pseudarthrobacter TaxID=2647000 RepID=UPI003629B4FE
MTIHPRLRTLTGFLSVAAMLAIAGCSNALGTPADAGTTSDKITLGISRQITSLDPGDAGSLDSDASVQKAIFSGLTRYDADFVLHGELAEKWAQDSPTQWTFTLRSGVKFSNGEAFDAPVAKWNFDRVLDPAAKFGQGGSLRPVIDEVEAPDATTLVIHTKGSYIDLPDRLSNFLFTEQKFAASHNTKTETLGTGPYVLDSVDLENGAKLTANPNYFGDKPAFNKAEYVVLSTETARVQAIQAGTVDAAIQFEPSDLKQFSDSTDYTTGNQWSTWNMSLRFNETVKPLDDVRVRQALNYAIDKKAIIRSIFGADIEPLKGQLISEPFDAINPELKPYEFDPAKAKELLAAAGHADGLELELGLSTGTYVAQDPIAQVIADQLKNVGVTLKITNQPFPAWVTRTYSEKDAPALYYIGYTSGYKAPAERLRIFTSTGSQSHYASPEYDDLIKKLTVAATPVDQQALVNEATELFRDQAHAAFLWPQPLTYVVKKDVSWKPRAEHWLVPQEFSPAS